MSRIIALIYGIASYAIGVASILYAIGFTTGLIVPKTIDTGDATPLGVAVAVDILLVTLFAVQHSIMARQGFKAWWTRIVPPAVERSTYVLFSSIALAVLFWLWRPIGVVVWSIEDRSLALAATAVALLGWVLVLASTFLINHFELFGLQQVASNLVGAPMPSAKFRTPLLYKVVRHPLYLGLVVAFWSAPTMTVGHLLFAALNTAYIFLGVALEERDLIALFGDDYRRYKERVPMLFPYRRSGERVKTAMSGRQDSAAHGD